MHPTVSWTVAVWGLGGEDACPAVGQELPLTCLQEEVRASPVSDHPDKVPHLLAAGSSSLSDWTLSVARWGRAYTCADRRELDILPTNKRFGQSFAIRTLHRRQDEENSSWDLRR